MIQLIMRSLRGPGPIRKAKLRAAAPLPRMWGLNYVSGIPSTIQKNILKLVVKVFVGSFVDVQVLDVEDFIMFGNEISIALSNLQLSKERMSNNHYGIKAKTGSIGSLKLSIAWKDLLSGALCVNIEGINVEFEVEQEEALDQSVWFDALSETIYETVEGLEATLEAEASEIFSGKEDDLRPPSTSTDTSQESSDGVKTILRTMIRDISVSATDITCALKITEKTTIQAKIREVILKDDTEDYKAKEIDDLQPSRSIYVAKTLQVRTVEVAIIEGKECWPIVMLKSPKKREATIDFSAKIYKDQSCEIEGYAASLSLFLTPLHVSSAAFVLKMLANGPLRVRSRSGGYNLRLSFIKVEVGQVDLYIAEEPFQMVDEIANGYRISLVESIASRFGLVSGESPINIVSSEYSITRIGASSHVVLCQSTEGYPVKVTLDQNGLHGEIKDGIVFNLDKQSLSLARKFQAVLDGFSRKEYANREDNDEIFPLSMSFKSFRFSIGEDIIPECREATFSMEQVLATLNSSAFSLSFHKASLLFNESHIHMEPTTLTRKVNSCPEKMPKDCHIFNDMHTMIEEEPYIGIASAEQSFAFQEAVQMAAEKGVIISCRGIKLSISHEDCLLLKKAAKNLKRPLTEDFASSSGYAKCLCAVIEAELKFGESVLKLILSDTNIFATRHIENFEKIIDVRSDVVSLSRKQALLVRRILNLSLDNSFKNIVLTAKRDRDGHGIVSGQVSGLEMKLPVKLDILEELDFIREMTKPNSVGPLPKVLEDGSKRTFKFASLYKCSLSPEFPKTWPRSFPSAVFAENIRIISREKGGLKIFLTGGTLFLARRHKNPLMLGIYEEGHTYWIEHGYASVCQVDFLKMTLSTDDGRLAKAVIENNEVQVEVREDSAHIVKHYFDYISNMGRYDVPAEPEAEPVIRTKTYAMLSELKEAKESVLASPNTAEEPSVESLDVMSGVEEDFFGADKQVGLEEESVFAEEDIGHFDDEGELAHLEPNEKWDAVLEMPAAESPEAFVIGSTDRSSIVFGQEAVLDDVVRVTDQMAEFDIDEEYFAKNKPQRDTFPFTSKEDLSGLRVQLVNFSVNIKLVEGSHFRHEPGRKLDAKPTVPSPYGVSPSDTLSSFRHSFSDDFTKKSSPSASVTGTSFTKWSAVPTMPPKVQGKADQVEIKLERINCEADWTGEAAFLASLKLAIPNFEVIDRVSKSRWKTVLARKTEIDEQTPLADGSTFDTMTRLELTAVEADSKDLEYRLKLRLLPLRIHLDQDTLKFILKFVATGTKPPPKDSEDEEHSDAGQQPVIEPLFFQYCDIGEISLRIDYKPKKIDFKNIQLGNFGEFVNFFQLEDAELRLPAASLRGVKGAGHFVAELMRVWVPFIKGTQVSKLVRGIGPVRTAINLGQGMTDLILLPMNEYTREGRVLRGLKEGASSFLHSTVLETARLGSKLAGGTKVVLEQVDDIFEGSSSSGTGHQVNFQERPENFQEGLLSAYQSLASSLDSAMQTIIAVPIQVYEKKGPEGAVKAVIRAVPVAVIKPLIGATEAVGKTLTGLEGSLDPARGIEIKKKYKRGPHDL